MQSAEVSIEDSGLGRGERGLAYVVPSEGGLWPTQWRVSCERVFDKIDNRIDVEGDMGSLCGE